MKSEWEAKQLNLVISKNETPRMVTKRRIQFKVTNKRHNGWRTFQLENGEYNDLLVIKNGDRHLMSVDIPERALIRFFVSLGNSRPIRFDHYAMEFRLTNRLRGRDGRLSFKTLGNTYETDLIIEDNRIVVCLVRIVESGVIEFYDILDGYTIEPHGVINFAQKKERV